MRSTVSSDMVNERTPSRKAWRSASMRRSSSSNSARHASTSPGPGFLRLRVSLIGPPDSSCRSSRLIPSPPASQPPVRARQRGRLHADGAAVQAALSARGGVMGSREFARGRRVVARLPHGGDLLAEIAAVADEHGMATAELRAIGALSEARLAFYDQETKAYGEFDVDGAVELLGLLGNVSRRDGATTAVSYTHLRAHETRHDLVCRLLLEKKKKKVKKKEKIY